MTRSLNPLRCDGTALPSGWLLSAKLLGFALFPGARFLRAGPPFLPFIPGFEAPVLAPWVAWLAPVTTLAFLGAFGCLLCNRLVRAACLMMAACVAVHIGAHQLEYANNVVFVGVFLAVIGMHDRRLGQWPLRIQLALVYGGASLNKALDPNWWNGRAFDTLMIDALGVRWYTAVSQAWPHGPTGSLFGLFTIAVEASISALALGSRGGRAAMWLMLVFHAGMLVATFGQLSVLFLYAAIAIAPALLAPSLSTEPARMEGGTPGVNTRVRRLVQPALWWALAVCLRVLPRLIGGH